MSKLKLYVASNLGYSPLNAHTLQRFVMTLSEMGFDVTEQFERTRHLSDPIALSKTIKSDIEKTDVVFAFLNGEPADGGVFSIIGYAAAFKKAIVFYRDDVRVCTDSQLIFSNLMMAVGFHTQETLQQHCYTAFDELTHPEKYLFQLISNPCALQPQAPFQKPTQPEAVTAYLANYYGFSSSMKDRLLSSLQQQIERCGVVVWEPFQRANDVVTVSGFDPFDIANQNARDILHCSLVIAVMNGEPVDIGICFELGFAAGLNIPCFLLRDDFRLAGPHPEFPFNPILAMVFKNQEELKTRFCTHIETLCAAIEAFVFETEVY